MVLVGFVIGIGCGRQNGDRPQTHPVTGTVTLNGEPVEGATVSFDSTEGKQSAVGLTDASGKYDLTTFGKGDGAVAGQYNVKIVKWKAAAPVATGEAESEGSAAMPAVGSTGEEENLLPKEYSDPKTSGFSVTVSEGENTHDFALQK